MINVLRTKFLVILNTNLIHLQGQFWPFMDVFKVEPGVDGLKPGVLGE